MALLAQHAEKMLNLWIQGKMHVKEDGRLMDDEALKRHELEMELIKKIPYNKKVHQSIYDVDTTGRITLSMPMGTPDCIAGRELGKAKEHERYTKVARRLQMKLIKQGKTNEDLNPLRSF